MNAFYNSDEDIAWGKVTPREIKRHVKSQIGKKPHRRHSAVNLSYSSSSNEIMESSGSSTNSKLKDITNKYNISGTSTQYFTANDTFKTGTRNNSCMELPKTHLHPEMMLDNFYATLVNNTVLSDDAGYDISVESRGNNICTPHTNDKDSVIFISDDDDEDQNGHHSSFDFKQCRFDRLSKLKCERLSDYEADTSDYHENVTLESEDVSEAQINATDCISLSSIDEDSENCISAERHEIVEHQDNNSKKNNQKSVILEEEASRKIHESLCGYNDSILGHEKESITHRACQSRSEINSMQQTDCQSANEIYYSKCDDYVEHCDVPQNTQEYVNVTRHSSSEWSRDLGIILDNRNVDSSTPEKNMIGDIHCVQDAHKYFERESPNKYFENDSFAESEDFDLDNSNDSSNKEEFDNTLERIEKLLNQQLELANKSVANKNKRTSTSTSSVSTEGSRIPRPVKSPYVGDVFKVPQSIEKKKLRTPKSASKLNFKDVVSPVGLYIKYSPQPVLKRNVNAVELKCPAFLKKIPTSPQVSEPKGRNCQGFPAAIYKPSGKQIITPAKKLFLPPSLEKMVHEPEMVKHEGRINADHNKSDIDRYLCEAELTRSSFSDSVLDSSSQNISVLTTKHTFA